MKKFLIAAAAVAAITGAAGAASAQPYGGPDRPRYDGAYGGQQRPDGDYRGGYRGGYGANAIDAKQAAVAMRINRGERMGALTRRDARNLRVQLWQVADMERRFRVSGGLDRREIGMLNYRLDRLDRVIVAQIREFRDGGRYGQGQGQGYGYGYGDREHGDRDYGDRRYGDRDDRH